MCVEPRIDQIFLSFHNCISLSINGFVERFIPSVSYVGLAISSVRLIFLIRPNRLSQTHDCFSFGSNTPPYYNNIDKHAIKYRGDIIFFYLCSATTEIWSAPISVTSSTSISVHGHQRFTFFVWSECCMFVVKVKCLEAR